VLNVNTLDIGHPFVGGGRGQDCICKPSFGVLSPLPVPAIPGTDLTIISIIRIAGGFCGGLVDLNSIVRILRRLYRFDGHRIDAWSVEAEPE